MSRQYVDFKVVGSDKDSGEEDVNAIKPVSDGEPAQESVFVRPSENLRTRTEVLRAAANDSKFLHDSDRSWLLSGTGSITWAGLPTGTFSSSAEICVKPFLAPAASSASRLIIGAGTAQQITIRTRQDGASGQPRAYNGANTFTFDFTPLDTGTGVVVITVDGTPANNFHVQYDSNIISGTTVQQMLNYLNNVVPSAGGAAFVAAGLEAVVEGTGSPPEAGFPVPPAPVVGNKVTASGPEQAIRFMAGAADAEKHNISPAQLTTFFADPLNQLEEGDVIAIRYDDLVMVGDGGRRQSIDELPEDKADDAGLNLFLMRRFPERLPNAIPLAAVSNGALIFINNRSFASGEVGPLVTAGASYQGSPTPPNSWADGTAVSGPISFETALDTVIQTLGTKAGGTPGAIKVGFTPSGNIAANTVKGAIEELDTEKAGLSLVNTFSRTNTFTASVAAETAVVATGNTTGAGVNATGGVTNGIGVIGTGQGSGVGGSFTGGTTPTTGGVLGTGSSHASGGPGVVGRGTGTGTSGVGGDFLNSATATAATPAVLAVSQSAAGGPGVSATGTGTYSGVVATGGATNGPGVTATATGTGSGVVGNGGPTSGHGLAGFGGPPNGNGVLAAAAGSGSGVVATGGTSGNGVTSTGAGVGAGISATGGSNGRGGTFLAGGGNNHGVHATSTGTGNAVEAIAGANSGMAVHAVGHDGVGVGDNGGLGFLAKGGDASSGDGSGGSAGQFIAGFSGSDLSDVGGAGVTATGGDGVDGGSGGVFGGGGAALSAGHGVVTTGGAGQDSAGHGVFATGGAGTVGGVSTPGYGVRATGGTDGASVSMPGVLARAGINATGATPQNALEVANGNIKMSGTTPNATVAIPGNTLTPGLIPKAWAAISYSGGSATLTAGQNITSVALDGSGDIIVTIADDVGATSACPLAMTSVTGFMLAIPSPQTGSPYKIVSTDYLNAHQNLTAQSGKVSFLLFGLP